MASYLFFRIGQTGLRYALTAVVLAAVAAGTGCHQHAGQERLATGAGQAVDGAEPAAAAPSELLVREAQFLLTELGFAPGPIDGHPGPLTVAAVSEFQEQTALAADGRITRPLVDALWARVDQAATREVQERLAVLGYDPGAPDGTATLQTVVAVTQFQKDAGFKADGRIDWNLLQRLRAAEVAQQAPESEPQDGGEAPKPTVPENGEVRTADDGQGGDDSVSDAGVAGADLGLIAVLPEADPIAPPAPDPAEVKVAPGDTILVYVSAWEGGPERFQVNQNGLLVLPGGVSLKTTSRNLQDLEDALMSKLLEQRITELSEAGGDEESITEEASQFLLDLEVELTKEASS